jgi:hypothetical protein
MNLASTWVSELGLTEEETLVVVRSVMARKRDGKPPNSFSYFSAAMTRFSAKKQAKLEKHQRKAAQEKEARDVDVSRARKASEIGAKVVPGNAVRDRITASVAERILRSRTAFRPMNLLPSMRIGSTTCPKSTRTGPN